MKIDISSGLTKFLPELSVQLAEHGLNIFPTAKIIRSMAFNGPVTISDKVIMIRSKINSYSNVNKNSIIATATIDRYSSIGHGVEIGLGIHKPHALLPPTFISASLTSGTAKIL